MALAVLDQRREHVDAASSKLLQHQVDDALLGVLDHLLARNIGAGVARAGEEQAQEVVDLGGGADGRARVLVDGLLLYGYDGAETRDMVDIRALQIAEHIAGIRRERLDIASLTLGKDGVESKRRLARTRQAGDYRQRIVRNLHIDVFQVVHPRAYHAQSCTVRCLILLHFTIHASLNTFCAAVDLRVLSLRGTRTV